MVEGASIDKQAHESEAERTIWDTIEFDNAVQVALDFARRTNSDADPANDTLVSSPPITRAAASASSASATSATRRRSSAGRCATTPRSSASSRRRRSTSSPTTPSTRRAFRSIPIPTRKLLIGFAAGPDRYENWLSNRLAQVGTVRRSRRRARPWPTRGATDPARTATTPAWTARATPGSSCPASIENGATGCPDPQGCPDDTRASPLAIAGHTASDVPLSAEGPGAWQFTGVYENTDVFLKLLRAAAGSYPRAAALADAAANPRAQGSGL